MQYLPWVANVLMLGALLLGLRHLPPQIPLFYSRPWGEAQLVDWWYIFLLPLLMNGLYFLNKFVLKRYFSANEFVSTFLTYLNIFILVAFTFVFIKIIFLVT